MSGGPHLHHLKMWLIHKWDEGRGGHLDTTRPADRACIHMPDSRPHVLRDPAQAPVSQRCDRMLYTRTRDGKWRTITVKTRDPGLDVRARAGYYAPAPAAR